MTERKRRRRREHPEISWTFTPRIEAGEYRAFSVAGNVYRDRQFKRWVCAIHFDIRDDSLLVTLARLTWYLNLGAKETPRAGRRGNYWAAWVQANGGPPRRNDRLSSRVFEGRYAVVRVEDTTKTHRQSAVNDGESYSVIRDVVKWETGVPSR